MNGSSGVSIRDNGPTDSTFKLPAEPPQKKRFQISAHEDYQELADDDSRSNGGHVSTIPFGQNKKPETSVFGNKDVSAEVIQSPPVEKIPGTQKTDDSKSLPKTSFKSVDGSVVNKKVAFNLPASNNNTQPQPAAITDTVSPQKKATVFQHLVVPLKLPRTCHHSCFLLMSLQDSNQTLPQMQNHLAQPACLIQLIRKAIKSNSQHPKKMTMAML